MPNQGKVSHYCFVYGLKRMHLFLEKLVLEDATLLFNVMILAKRLGDSFLDLICFWLKDEMNRITTKIVYEVKMYFS